MIDRDGGHPPNLSALDKILALPHFSSSRIGFSAIEAAEFK
jgi:hypothetical protein